MKKIAFLLFISLFTISCKKEETVKSTIELLTNASEKTWKLKDATIKLSQDTKLSIIGSRPLCETDNLLILKSNLTYDFTEGATKCRTTDPDFIIRGLEWSLSADEKSMLVDKFIFLNFEIKNAIFNLTSVTESSFKGTTEVEYNGTDYVGDVEFEVVN